MPTTPLITSQIAELTARVDALEAGDLPCPYDPDEPIPSYAELGRRIEEAEATIALLRSVIEPHLDIDDPGSYTIDGIANLLRDVLGPTADEPIPSILNAAKHWTTDHTCRVAIELLRMAEPRLEAEGRGYTFLVWYDAEPDNVLHAARNQVDGLEVVESTRTERTDAPEPKSDL